MDLIFPSRILAIAPRKIDSKLRSRKEVREEISLFDIEDDEYADIIVGVKDVGVNDHQRYPFKFDKGFQLQAQRNGVYVTGEASDFAHELADRLNIQYFQAKQTARVEYVDVVYRHGGCTSTDRYLIRMSRWETLARGEPLPAEGVIQILRP